MWRGVVTIAVAVMLLSSVDAFTQTVLDSQLGEPRGLAVDDAGNVLVTERRTSSVKK